MEKTRDSAGRLQADKKRFPSGIKALADYVCFVINRKVKGNNIHLYDIYLCKYGRISSLHYFTTADPFKETETRDLCRYYH